MSTNTSQTITTRKLAYPISKLSAISAIDNTALIELSVKNNEDTWESRSTTVADFGNYIITAHAIFNNLYDLYYTLPNSIVFTKPTYFRTRPTVQKIADDSTILNLDETSPAINSLVTLYDVQKYVKETGIAVQAVGKNSRYRRYVTTRNGMWQTSDGMWQTSAKPTVSSDNEYMKSIYEATNSVNFTLTELLGSDFVGYATEAIVAEKDMLVTVIANLLLTKPYDALTTNSIVPYYNHTANHWLGLIIISDDNEPIVGTISQFTDIMNVGEFAIAQVQLTMPISKNTKFCLFTPAAINTTAADVSSIKESTKFQRSLFAGLNEAHVAYYDNDL